MKRILFAIILSLPLLILTSGCKDKEKEQVKQAPPPPIDTQIAIDMTPVIAEDTLPAVLEMPGMPPAPLGDGYAVQVASCTDESYARYLVEIWTGRGYEPFVSTITHNDETHYRVRLGLFLTHSEAKQMTAELQDKYTLKTWIDKVSY